MIIGQDLKTSSAMANISSQMYEEGSIKHIRKLLLAAVKKAERLSISPCKTDNKSDCKFLFGLYSAYISLFT